MPTFSGAVTGVGRHLENGFEQVLERYWAGLEPEHVVVQPMRQA
jgi:hypothetical protein